MGGKVFTEVRALSLFSSEFLRSEDAEENPKPKVANSNGSIAPYDVITNSVESGAENPGANILLS